MNLAGPMLSSFGFVAKFPILRRLVFASGPKRKNFRRPEIKQERIFSFSGRRKFAGRNGIRTLSERISSFKQRHSNFNFPSRMRNQKGDSKKGVFICATKILRQNSNIPTNMSQKAGRQHEDAMAAVLQIKMLLGMLVVEVTCAEMVSALVWDRFFGFFAGESVRAGGFSLHF
jgi:hypothetical protein